MLGLNQFLLINILGHAGGALIFAIFLCLLFSGRGWSGTRGRNLSALAAVLSMAWNVGSLIALAWPGLAPAPRSIVVAFSFSMLSLLPAVLLHLSLENSQPILVRCGYLLSAVAVAMHFREIYGNGAALHQMALLLITVGFLALTAIAAATVAFRRDASPKPGGGRIMASMCLALFAMSFVHFGNGHADQAWSSELVIHHAGIPLALFVLLQDYRFVLLDAFVRFLANALLAAVLAGFMIEAAFRLVPVGGARQEPLPEAVLMTSICFFLVLFAWLRGRVQDWLTFVVLRQGAVSQVPDRVKASPEFTDEPEYLEWAASVIATGFRTKDRAVVSQAEWEVEAGLAAPVTATLFSAVNSSRRWNWAQAVAPVRLGEGQSKFILLGGRAGGQRYLSHDLNALTKAAAEIVEKVESLRRHEMNRLVSQAELRALQSQINPHFLFNALNTLYGTIPREAAAARKIVLNLADIFRYSLQSDKPFVPLADELQIVRAYLDVEQLRLGNRLTVEIKVDDGALQVPIPVLSIQPLVENAIKHGIARRTEPGHVRIKAECRNDELRITVENSSAGAVPPNAGSGVGLQNVRRRLEICYGASADLLFSLNPVETTVELSIPLVRSGVAR